MTGDLQTLHLGRGPGQAPQPPTTCPGLSYSRAHGPRAWRAPQAADVWTPELLLEVAAGLPPYRDRPARLSGELSKCRLYTVEHRVKTG